MNLLCVPFGCMISGMFTEYLGKRRAMQVISIHQNQRRINDFVQGDRLESMFSTFWWLLLSFCTFFSKKSFKLHQNLRKMLKNLEKSSIRELMNGISLPFVAFLLINRYFTAFLIDIYNKQLYEQSRIKISTDFPLQIIKVPVFFSWIIFYYSQNVYHLYIALCLSGTSGGLLETPVSY